MSINDCYVCCNSLNSGTLYTLHPEALEADAKHQIHENCLIQLRDLSFLENPLATDFRCGLCRNRVAFPATILPSVQRISNWLNIVHYTIETGLCLTGLIGFMAGPFILDYLLSNKISELPYPTSINISLRVLPVLIIGSIGKLFRHNSQASSCMRTVATMFYNWKYGTELIPEDIIFHDCSMTNTHEIQLSIIANSYISDAIQTLREFIIQFPFNSEELKTLAPFLNQLDTLQNTPLQINLEKSWITHLQSNHPDLIEKLAIIKMRILSRQGNKNLKNLLYLNAYNFLISQYTINKQCIIHDLTLAIKISLIHALRLYIDYPPEGVNLRKKQEWTALLNSFIEEIQNPNGQLLSELKNELEEKFNRPIFLTQLFNPKLTGKIFLSLLIIRQKTFEERGFSSLLRAFDEA